MTKFSPYPIMLKLAISCMFACIVSGSVPSYAQSETPVSQQSASHFADSFITLNIDSEHLGEERPVLVRLPTDYAATATKDYPVLFVLNEKSNFEWASYIVDLQASKFGIEDMLIVGLPHIGQYTRDNYPFAAPKNNELNPQAQKYSAFIRQEVIPLIEERYRVNNGRTIIGHSLSGLFAMHMFTQHNDTFSTFVALSPSLHQAPQMIPLMQEFLGQQHKRSSQIYMSLGSLEHGQIQQGYDALADVFQQTGQQSGKWELNRMPNTDHLLAAFKGTYNALAWMYADYTIQSEAAETMQKSDYISHYDDLSDRLGYPVKPRKRHLTGYAQFMARRVGNRQAAFTALDVAAHYYPTATDIDTLREELNALPARQ
ncbi:MAG: alpha/beta hydrolase-fold protein [Erythrobacter sp.]|uniref:alpha/beta hydrolase n=1 Tax=Erythrobacter sp. TaxID=1042 RepID=UPI003264C1C8